MINQSLMINFFIHTKRKTYLLTMAHHIMS